MFILTVIVPSTELNLQIGSFGDCLKYYELYAESLS